MCLSMIHQWRHACAAKVMDTDCYILVMRQAVGYDLCVDDAHKCSSKARTHAITFVLVQHVEVLCITVVLHTETAIPVS